VPGLRARLTSLVLHTGIRIRASLWASARASASLFRFCGANWTIVPGYQLTWDFALDRCCGKGRAPFANDKYELNSIAEYRSNETRWGWMLGGGIGR
jgi:hypothetical protein